jgi:hypothetical protein
MLLFIDQFVIVIRRIQLVAVVQRHDQGHQCRWIPPPAASCQNLILQRFIAAPNSYVLDLHIMGKHKAILQVVESFNICNLISKLSSENNK